MARFSKGLAGMFAGALALAATPAAADATSEILLLLGGAIGDAAHPGYAEDVSDAAIPLLPVIYENDRGD
jgi:hypothetical protein